MVELAIAGAALLGFLGGGMAVRHHLAIVSAASRLQENEPEKAFKHLSFFTKPPSLPWEQNQQALCLNLCAHALALLGRRSEAEALCSRLLKAPKVASPIRGLVYHRLAQLAQGSDIQVYMEQGDRLWAEELPELKGLKLWETLGYFFWGTQDYSKAAYCFEQSLETHWTGQNLFMRYLCHSLSSTDHTALLAMAKEALRYNKLPLQKSYLCLALSIQHNELGNHSEALEAAQKGLKSRSNQDIQHGCYRMALRQLRILGRDEEATQLRTEWIDSLGSDGLITLLGLYHDDGEFEHAYELLYPHLESEEAKFRYAVGTLLLELGRPEQALPHLTAALGQAFYPSAACHLVRAYLKLNMRPEAERYLAQLTGIEQDWARAIRSNLAYAWDATPELAKTLEGSDGDLLWRALYTGDFDGYLREQLRLLQAQTLGLAANYRLAKFEYGRANALHWAKDYQAALKSYQKALPLFTGSPRDRDLCALCSLECRAFLGEPIGRELENLQQHLLSAYPGDREIQLDSFSTAVSVQMATRQYDLAIASVTDYLEQQPRRFMRAKHLQDRAEAYFALKLPEQGLKDCRQILQEAPGSFLADWAQGRLSQENS